MGDDETSAHHAAAGGERTREDGGGGRGVRRGVSRTAPSRTPPWWKPGKPTPHSCTKNYVPSKVTQGATHPDHVVETSTLSQLTPPDVPEGFDHRPGRRRGG